MSRHLVVLRALNVGGRNRVRMAELVAGLEADGFGSVASRGVAGNLAVTLDADAAEVARRVEAVVLDVAAVDTTAIVRTPDQIQGLIDRFPWPEADPKQSGVVFLDAATDAEPDATGFAPDTCVVAPDRTDVWVHCPSGFSRTRLTAGWVEKQTGTVGTRRNRNTLVELIALAAS